MKRYQLNTATPYLFLAPAAIIVLVALFFPLLYMVYGSFRAWDPSQTLSESEFIGFGNYTKLWLDATFWESVSVTLKFAISVVVFFEMIVGAWIRDVVGGRGDVCFAGTHSGIILIYVAMNLPFVIWILQSFIVQVPRSLEEAARIDRAGPFQVFFRIMLPLIKPGLAAAAIFTFRIAWNEYLLASVLSDRNTKTVPKLIVNNTSEFKIERGTITATGMLLAVPPILFTLVASRQFITGMTAGAVKG